MGKKKLISIVFTAITACAVSSCTTSKTLSQEYVRGENDLMYVYINKKDIQKSLDSHPADPAAVSKDPSSDACLHKIIIPRNESMRLPDSLNQVQQTYYKAFLSQLTDAFRSHRALVYTKTTNKKLTNYFCKEEQGILYVFTDNGKMLYSWSLN